MKNLLVALLVVGLGAELALARNAGARRSETTRPETARPDKSIERLRSEKPNAIDNATSRQKTSEEVRIEAKIDEALNGQLANERLLTNKDGLVELARENPISRLEEIVFELVTLQLNLRQQKGIKVTERQTAVNNSLEALNSIAEQAFSTKFRSEQGKAELADFYSFIRNEVLQALKTESTSWTQAELINLNSFLAAVGRGAKLGKSLREIVEEHGRFTWEEFQRRCRGKA